MAKRTEVALVSEDQLSIFVVRENKVMLDADIARLYGVSTKVLNQAVKRNISRFPEDFMFELTKKEKEEVVTNCDHLQGLKYSYHNPYAFTEQGVAMLSSVINSERAIQVNIYIMRVFIKMRTLSGTNINLAKRIEDLETNVLTHNDNMRVIFWSLNRLTMRLPESEREEQKKMLKKKGSEII
jgi:hypothetical protein